MSQFEDPSIISMVSAASIDVGAAPQPSEKTEDNAITKFLREAEYKREEEELKRTTPSVSSESRYEDRQSTKAPAIDSTLENWKLDLGPYNETDRLRYSMDFLYSLKDSPHNFVSSELPSESYYRFRAKPLQRTNHQNKNYNNNGNNNYNGRNNYNEGGQSTGSMGNFNLGKRNDRGFNSRYGNNNRRNNRDNRHNKRHGGDDDDSWLAELEKDEPAGGSAEDFENWKAKMKLAERKRRGEVVDEGEFSALSSGAARKEEPKNAIDSFFTLAKPSMNKSDNSSKSGTPDVGKNSKFFSFFKPEANQQDDKPNQQPSGNDGVSKILSLLDSGEKNAQAGSNNSTPQPTKASPSQPPQVQSQVQQQQQSRSQFNFQQQNQPTLSQPQNASPAGAPMAPPGLAPPSNNQISGMGGSRDSFFMSLMNKTGPEQGSLSEQGSGTPEVATKSMKESQVSQKSDQPQQAQAQSQTQQHPSQQRVSSLPPGLQGPPGLQQQAGSQQAPQQNLQGQPMIPPQFQNGNRVPMQGTPPGFNPQQVPPPWMQQQFPPNMPNMPQGRFMAPPPNGLGFAPQMRQNGPPGVGNIPPQLLYAQGGQSGQNAPPGFFQPFGGPGNLNQDGQQREQQRFPPGFFNAPPPGYQQRDPDQQ